MSEVAVKIYETKKEIQRIHLAEPIYGKDGRDQLGTWVDTDTGQKVDHYIYRRMGSYLVEQKAVITGDYSKTNYSGPFDSPDGEHLVKVTDIPTFSKDIEYYKILFLVTCPNLKVNIVGFTGMKPTLSILHCHITIRFMDE